MARPRLIPPAPRPQIVPRPVLLSGRYALSPAEAAEYAGVSETTIRHLIRTGALPAKKAGTRTLVLRSEVERWIDSLPAHAAGEEG